MRPRLASVVLLLPLALTATGCQRSTHPNGSNFCGHHLDTGANDVGFAPLDRTIPPPPVRPTASVLPALSSVQDLQAEYIRTSPSCSTGAVVTVAPPDATSLIVAIRADSGGITGIGLDPSVTVPVTVSAWVKGQYQGSLVLQPLSAPSSNAPSTTQPPAPNAS